jgi:uncharacterized glyoxalase superfamily protein PhnB
VFIMADVKPIPEGYERVIPHLVVKNCAEALRFYQEAFGAKEHHRSPAPDGKRIMHAEMSIGPSMVFLCDDFPEYNNGNERHPVALGGSPVTIHHYVENVDDMMARAERAGATVTMAAQDTFWGDRYGQVKDPFGHTWSFATHVRDVSPEEMAEAAKAHFS